FFSSRRRHTRWPRDWSSDVCSSDLELREIGIQADALLCRTLQPLPEEERRKIALFTNVQKEAVISAWDVDSIYKIPMMLHDQMRSEERRVGKECRSRWLA